MNRPLNDPAPTDIEAPFDPFALGAIECAFPSTEAQREIWLAAQTSDPASLAYNEANALRLRGPLSASALQSALQQLTARHQSLRATLSADGTQLLIAAPGPFDLPCVDLVHTPEPERQRRILLARQATVRQPFPLQLGPLFRAQLLRLAPDDHTLLWSAHHAVCDGWSWTVLQDELGRLYAQQLGLGPGLDPAPPYEDYARWQDSQAAGPDMAGHTQYWLSRFQGPNLPVLDLPTDRLRPAVRSFRSRRVDHLLGPQILDPFRKVASQAGSTLYAALFAAFAALLHRLSGQQDLVIGIASAGQLASDMPRLVGHCVNLLPVRLEAAPQMPFDELVRDSAHLLLDAADHQALTYATLLRKLIVPRDPARAPLLGVLFNIDPDTQRAGTGFPELEVQTEVVPRAFESFELFLNMTPTQGGLRMEMQYNADLFEQATIARWLEMYETLLDAAGAAPQTPLCEFKLLSGREAERLDRLQPARTPVEEPPLMHAGFAAMAAAHPDRIGLHDGQRPWSYRELDERSNQLAHTLRGRGIRRGERVGLCLERDADMLVAILGVLKSGAAYVPLDPSFPKARLDYYARDARMGLLITRLDVVHAPRRWRETADEQVLCLDTDTQWLEAPMEGLPPGAADAQPQDTAYLLYTSGSTGEPKGVCIPHVAVANLLQSIRLELGIGAEDRLAAVTTPSFDISVLELMLPLCAGAQIVLVDNDTAKDGKALGELLAREGITVFQATPGRWRMLLEAQWPGQAGLKAITGGETLSRELALALVSRCAAVWNMYGPTETTVYSTLWRVDAAMLRTQAVTIGRPIANTTVWVLDAQGERCPVGVPGELWIGGLGVGTGYFGREALTRERFQADPYEQNHGGQAPPRLYRTGDRGRWRNDGLLEHLGRLDFQLKVRGYRIEPGEIEAACQEVAAVGAAVVVAREAQPGDVRLVAYLVAKAGAVIDPAEVERALGARLPVYMRPQHVVVLEALPRLPNGKVDRQGLPAPQAARDPAPASRTGPRDPREASVLRAMEQVLSLPGLGMQDDFFALGGHSLLAARLAARLSREFEVRVPLRTLFMTPTPEGLAAALGDLLKGGGERDAPIVPVPGRRSAALTPMQERICFLEELHPGRSVYNSPSAHRLRGRLDVGAFHAALCEVVRRQPALRTHFSKADERGGAQALVAAEVPIDLPLVDLRGLPADQREQELAEVLQALADRPIDIHRAPLFHAVLVCVDEEDHVFGFVPHHLVWDGWSTELLVNELTVIYEAQLQGRAHGLAALPVTHGDYAQWHASWLGSPACERQMGFWKERFAGFVVPKGLATQKPRRTGMSGEGGTQWISLDAESTRRLKSAARTHGVTLNMLMLGVYALMLGELSQTNALVVASPVRGREAPELEGVMGFFNNLVLLGLTVGGQATLSGFLREVKEELVAAMSNQGVPFEQLASEPEFGSRARGVGLYQALFSFEDASERRAAVADLRFEPMALSQRGATEDLGLWLTERPSGIDGGLTYNADLYRLEAGVALRNRYVELLGRVAAEPGVSMEALLRTEGSGDAMRLRALLAGEAETATPARLGAGGSPVAPPTGLSGAKLAGDQLRLGEVWAEVLKMPAEDLRASDSFFDLGGDSLLAMRAIQKAEQAMGFRVAPPRYVFETLGQLASKAAFTVEAGGVVTQPQATAGALGRMFSGWRKKGN